MHSKETRVSLEHLWNDISSFSDHRGRNNAETFFTTCHRISGLTYSRRRGHIFRRQCQTAASRSRRSPGGWSSSETWRWSRRPAAAATSGWSPRPQCRPVPAPWPPPGTRRPHETVTRSLRACLDSRSDWHYVKMQKKLDKYFTDSLCTS